MKTKVLKRTEQPGVMRLKRTAKDMTNSNPKGGAVLFSSEKKNDLLKKVQQRFGKNFAKQ